jgi:hypothetical protein
MRRLDGIVDDDERRGMAGLLRSLGNDDGDRLAVPAHPVILENWQLAGRARSRVVGIHQGWRLHPRRIRVAQDRYDPWRGSGGGRIDG